LVEILFDPTATPLHLHEAEDEHIVVLEGAVRIAYGDNVFDSQFGDVVTLGRAFQMFAIAFKMKILTAPAHGTDGE